MKKILGLVTDLQVQLQKAAVPNNLPKDAVVEASPGSSAAAPNHQKPGPLEDGDNATVRAPSHAGTDAEDSEAEESVASDHESERVAESEALLEAQEEAKAAVLQKAKEAKARPVATPVRSFEPADMEEDASSTHAHVHEPSMPATASVPAEAINSSNHKREYMRLEAWPSILILVLKGSIAL